MEPIHDITEAGQSMVEYSFVILLVSLAAFAALTNIGPGVASIFSSVAAGF